MENVEEGNKLIAEFMGCMGRYIWCANEEVLRYGFESTHITELWHESEFDEMTPYHTSWDWLMPVVEKIESIGRTSVEIGKTHCRIQPILYNKAKDCMEWQLMHEATAKTKIEAVYNSVVSFIQWYNQNQ